MSKLLWRIYASDREHQAFQKFVMLAHKIQSSIDFGHLEGRPAAIVGIIIDLAMGMRPTFKDSQIWPAHVLRTNAAEFNWPDATEVVVACLGRIDLDAKEAELFLEVAKALVETSVEAKLGLGFDWDEEQS
jgi:hypothetical protein